MGRAEDKRQAARDAAAHHGLKAAVPHYLEAAQALVEARRPEEAVDLLGELLVAQEKKRGLFSRVEKNPLGPSRAHVAVKFAEYSRMAAPTEDILELLSELSLEQPDDLTIRRANADALYNAGYIADATEEYRYCLRLSPDDGQILSRLTDAYAEMGRNDHAIEFLRRGMRVHADAKDYGQAMHLAIRWLGIAPGAAEDVLILLKDWPADALRRQIGGINQLAMLAKKDDTRDAAWHKAVAAEFAALGASGRPELVTEPPVAAKPSMAPAAASAKAPEIRPAAPSTPVGPSTPAAPPPSIAPSKPTAAQPAAPSAPAAAASAKPTPVMAKPVDVKPTPPAPAPAKHAVPASEQLKIIQPQRPASAPTPPARPAQPAPAQPPRPTVAPSAPPAGAQTAPPTAAKSPVGAKPSAPLPTLEKVLEEADKRKAATPPEPARPAAASGAASPAAKPPIEVKPGAPAPAATVPPQRPPIPQQRPTAAPPQATAAQPPSAPPKLAEVQPSAPAPAAAQPAAPAEPARPAAGGTAAGIKNFARRKAKELHDAGDYENAVASLERVARFGADAETLQMLLTCYTQLNRPEDAKRVGMELADLEVEAGRVESAVAALTTLAKTVPDPEVLKRRSELLAAKK